MNRITLKKLRSVNLSILTDTRLKDGSTEPNRQTERQKKMIERLAEHAIRLSVRLNIPLYDAVQVVTKHLTQEQHNEVLRYIVSSH